MLARTKRLLFAADQVLASGTLPITREKGVLLSFLFHALFETSGEAQSGLMDPQQGTTVPMLRRLIDHFQKQGYEFIAPAEILKGLHADGRYVLLTFDDGYRNNVRALPVLEAAGVPATLFISSDHVKLGKAFWWDVAYREGKRRSRSEKEIRKTILGLKRLKSAEIEKLIRAQFGAAALQPAGELDRPFTPAELRDFAAHPLISLGNHTRDHAILTNCSVPEAREQIAGAQADIREMTGKTPEMIAYPNGDVSARVVRAAAASGLRLGIGIHPGRNRASLRPGSRAAMNIKRFLVWGDRGTEEQCRTSRSAISLDRLIHAVKVKSPGSRA
jgi:peptidoglycan/xylan/chitin deacetylase (PgdA/CDA1 family)